MPPPPPAPQTPIGGSTLHFTSKFTKCKIPWWFERKEVCSLSEPLNCKDNQDAPEMCKLKCFPHVKKIKPESVTVKIRAFWSFFVFFFFSLFLLFASFFLSPCLSIHIIHNMDIILSISLSLHPYYHKKKPIFTPM